MQWRAEWGALRAERGALRAERGALRAERGALRAERGALRAERGTRPVSAPPRTYAEDVRRDRAASRRGGKRQ
ncbi:hypothetical protein [Streptomyces sp. NL15-2K]|uniref:hypothetical protein n=1 Tax=Streptomyces sp. NL15-2K TaxID=376149 RepID=UPI000FFA5BB1|nr:hypothetical protein [Streptomyces sp. NL15-2K]GCB50495.1 hypothetical protein SNL152K_7839 [Streptomyces sp. NL15-2K]